RGGRALVGQLQRADLARSGSLPRVWRSWCGAYPGASTIQAATNKSESFVDFVKWSSGQVVVRVRHYREVSIQAGGVLTAHGWDGGTGGIVVYRASGRTTVAGTITVAGSDGVWQCSTMARPSPVLWVAASAAAQGWPQAAG